MGEVGAGCEEQKARREKIEGTEQEKEGIVGQLIVLWKQLNHTTDPRLMR